jgi:MSHA pilin protein MshD
MCITERRRERGVTLLELIIFIVVVSTAVMGILTALDLANRSSTDPMIQKQALAIAEALLEEVQLQPFTYCDPDDSQAATADSATVGATGCTAAASVEATMAAETTPPYGPETRTDATTPFDNVNDYNGFSMGPGITDLTGAAITGLEKYSASVVVANPLAAQMLGTIPSSDTLFITVTVTGPANTTVVLHGYRTRYAPNALP